MASPYKPELFTIESVMDFYHNADGVHFKVFGGTTAQPQFCRYIFDGNEKEIGMQKLEEALYGLKSNTDNTNPYLIQVFSNPKKKGEPLNTTNIVFQLNKVERILPYMGGMMQPATDPELKNILLKIVEGQNLLVSKLSSEEFEQEEEEPMSINKAIGSMLQNPETQAMLLSIGGELLSGFMNRLKQPSAPMTQGIAGIPETNESIEILNSLMNKGVTIEHLRKLDSMSLNKLSTLLMML
jgi:hypothetical protein